MKLIMECEVKSSCAFFKSKAERRMMLKLRGGTVAFQIEIGRWHGLKREEQMCKECDSGEVEDVCHWLLQCSAWNHLRQPLLQAMDDVDFSTGEDGDRTALILSHACRNYHILSMGVFTQAHQTDFKVVETSSARSHRKWFSTNQFKPNSLCDVS